MTITKVRPLPGMLFRHPETLAPLPADGLDVLLTPFWRRALDRGDVVRCEPPLPSTAPQAATAPAAVSGGSSSPRKAK